ncbi:hypothetical protein Cgig2_005066 [Carnegiea gigantea]|uniref:Uncharacterized protein n=1 Tax=Carnegiea gigantea TaxID=171969 RepID=A0A9Q1QUH6_9CARY|nr:hypothetical protein Cgig2_005066 [Carnegiea gigantea]
MSAFIEDEDERPSMKEKSLFGAPITVVVASQTQINLTRRIMAIPAIMKMKFSALCPTTAFVCAAGTPLAPKVTIDEFVAQARIQPVLIVFLWLQSYICSLSGNKIYCGTIVFCALCCFSSGPPLRNRVLLEGIIICLECPEIVYTRSIIHPLFWFNLLLVVRPKVQVGCDVRTRCQANVIQRSMTDGFLFTIFCIGQAYYFFVPNSCTIRFGLHDVCNTSRLMLYNLNISFGLHVLVSGTKRIRLFPRLYYRPILGINSLIFCLLLCDINYSWLCVLPVLVNCSHILLSNVAVLSLLMGGVCTDSKNLFFRSRGKLSETSLPHCVLV